MHAFFLRKSLCKTAKLSIKLLPHLLLLLNRKAIPSFFNRRDWFSHFVLDGYNIKNFIEFIQERTGSTWNSKLTDKVRFIVGPYRGKVQFPQRKDGSWNFEKMLPLLENEIERCKKQEASNVVFKENEIVVETLRERFPLIQPLHKNSCGSLIPSHDPLRPVIISFNNLSFSAHDAEKVLKFFEELWGL